MLANFAFRTAAARVKGLRSWFEASSRGRDRSLDRLHRVGHAVNLRRQRNRWHVGQKIAAASAVADGLRCVTLHIETQRVGGEHKAVDAGALPGDGTAGRRLGVINGGDFAGRQKRADVRVSICSVPNDERGAAAATVVNGQQPGSRGETGAQGGADRTNHIFGADLYPARDAIGP